jgi:fumarylpyruvate hydrolase
MSDQGFVVAVPEPVSLPVAGTDRRFPVRRIYCVGRNYAEHIREMGGDEARDPPVFFQKPADSIVEDGGTVPYPPMTSDLHYELELVVALKGGGFNIPAARALDQVYGYGIGIDMTRRDRQRDMGKSGLPWEIGKSFDHSCPCGPVHPAEKTGHVQSGAIRLTLDGAVKQDSDVGLMIWKVPEIIANLSTYFELFPGDVILTGTPHGVGPVEPGSQLVGSIEGLGSLTVRIGPKAA